MQTREQTAKDLLTVALKTNRHAVQGIEASIHNIGRADIQLQRHGDSQELAELLAFHLAEYENILSTLRMMYASLETAIDCMGDGS